jgi:SurA N-terminal domain
VKRVVVVIAVVALAVLVVAIVAIVRHDSGSDRTVARAGGHRITQKQLELMVEHFHEEADREGRPFPVKGSKEYEQVQRIALGLLVHWAALQGAAARIGVHVTEAEVDARASAPSGESEEGGDARFEAEAAFRRGTTRTQLITEAVFRKLTAGVRVRPAEVSAYYHAHRVLYGSTPLRRVAAAIKSQLLSARKNAVMARWLAEERRHEPKPALP